MPKSIGTASGNYNVDNGKMQWASGAGSAVKKGFRDAVADREPSSGGEKYMKGFIDGQAVKRMLPEVQGGG